jgi:hypothetical protein
MAAINYERRVKRLEDRTPIIIEEVPLTRMELARRILVVAHPETPASAEAKKYCQTLVRDIGCNEYGEKFGSEEARRGARVRAHNRQFFPEEINLNETEVLATENAQLRAKLAKLETKGEKNVRQDQS